MPKALATHAIVIKRVNFGEADKLLTIFTRKHGKLVVLAKGIRKINSRKAPHLEFFSYAKVLLTAGRTWDYLVEAQTIENFSFLRTKIDRIAQAFQMVEEVERLCAERQAHKNIFDLLLVSFQKLNDRKLLQTSGIVEEFTLNFLWELGYLPYGKVIPQETLYKYLEQVMEKSLKSKNLFDKL